MFQCFIYKICILLQILHGFVRQTVTISLRYICGHIHIYYNTYILKHQNKCLLYWYILTSPHFCWNSLPLKCTPIEFKIANFSCTYQVYSAWQYRLYTHRWNLWPITLNMNTHQKHLYVYMYTILTYKYCADKEFHNAQSYMHRINNRKYNFTIFTIGIIIKPKHNTPHILHLG